MKRAVTIGSLPGARSFAAACAFAGLLWAAPTGAATTSEHRITRFESSPFGVAFGEGCANLDHFMMHIRGLGVRRTKVSFRWHTLEPRPGKYDWTAVDAYFRQLQPGDRALLNVFTTGWGTNRESGKGATFRDDSCKSLYRSFIVDLVKRSKGAITYWQRDTEPASPRHYPADKAAEYVEAQRIFYEAVKSVQPDSIVVGVNCNGEFRNGQPVNAGFFFYVLKNGKDYFDVVDVRLYKDIYDIPQRVEWFRTAMRHCGYCKPIICTEFGGPDPRALSARIFYRLKRRLARECSNAADPQASLRRWVREHRMEIDPKLRLFLYRTSAQERDRRDRIHCHDIVQRHMMAYAAGIRESWWWNLQSGGKHVVFGKMRLMEFPDTKFPAYYCFKRMVSKLSSISSIERRRVSAEGVYFFRITRRRQGPVYVVWRRPDALDFYDSESAAPASVSLPVEFNKVEVTDVFGNVSYREVKAGALKIEIGDTPLFIEEME